MGSNPTLRTKSAPIHSTDEFELFLKSKLTKHGYPLAESTIEHRVKAVRLLLRRFNLWDTKAVEDYIDQADWTNGRKEHVSLAYRNWCESKGFEFKPRKYRRQVKLPYIPTENEIDQLIGGFAVSKYGSYLQLLKETAFRPVEGSRLRPSDFDLVRRVVTLNEPAKNSNPRQVRRARACTNRYLPSSERC